MFITFEGSEGCGKSSQAARLSDFLQQQGYDILTTREPGGTPIGEQIREVISSLKNADMQQRTEILLFQASRAQLVEQVIRPHLDKGGVVISDRYADSTLAYQGYGYERDLAPLLALIQFATGGLKPDLTLLLDVDVEIGLKRRLKGGDWNRLDALQLEFYQRVRGGYFQLTQQEPQRWVVIDARQPFNQVQQAVRQVVMERLKAYSPAGQGR
jgi:dTMP kinase